MSLEDWTVLHMRIGANDQLEGSVPAAFFRLDHVWVPYKDPETGEELADFRGFLYTITHHATLQVGLDGPETEILNCIFHYERPGVRGPPSGGMMGIRSQPGGGTVVFVPHRGEDVIRGYLTLEAVEE